MTHPRALKGNTPDAYDRFYKLVLEAVCVEAGMELAVGDEAANAEVGGAPGCRGAGVLPVWEPCEALGSHGNAGTCAGVAGYCRLGSRVT